MFRSAGTDKIPRGTCSPMSLGEIPPVLLSECHADMASLGGGGVAEPGDDEEDSD